ncbi:MAG: NADH-quinone oxidoreductase subunit L [Planctomyces sp.]
MVGETLRNLLMIAWLLPLAGFAVEIFGGFWGTRRSRLAALLALGCIAAGFVCSSSALVIWGRSNHWVVLNRTADHHGADHHGAEGSESPKAETHDSHGHAESSDAGHADSHASEHSESSHQGSAAHAASGQTVYSGTIYQLAKFGSLEISMDYYIDSLTLVMFTMVTLIATCIHLFAMGYMSDELTDEYVDHHAHLANGHHVHRPGRFYRFFAFLSLFCFAMLGLVLAGNIFQVFVFWELVGICSFLLIGFYTERKSASNAANKAFIMNRVGDFGFLIGLMVLWTFFGTFRFGETVTETGTTPGLFQMIHRDGSGQITRGAEGDVLITDATGAQLQNEEKQGRSIPYSLLVVAGLGIFAGCIGKSAQFPLQTWLPDAMEGPTPVSALVHSATMVAAGVYLVGRFYPMFVHEVLLTIAYVGCITLFLAATIAVVATDIKKVLAYSTISQLGYMMLGLGVFGWGAGLFHLITHAFFKSLMFLCSGSVIHGCHHEQEMPKMGGLLKKMPITGITMLIGVIAISGLAIPGVSFPQLGWALLFTGAVLAILKTKSDAPQWLLIVMFLALMPVALLAGAYLTSSKLLILVSLTKVILLISLGLGLLIYAAGRAGSAMPVILFIIGSSFLLIPGQVAFSGFYSKDAVVASALAFVKANPSHFLLFVMPLLTAGITAFYMFRLWFYTFIGTPRDHHVYDHCHESPLVMTVPLIILSFFAAFCAAGGENGRLYKMIVGDEPSHVAAGIAQKGAITLPGHHAIHEVHSQAGALALLAAVSGTLIAFILYGTKLVNLDEMKRQLSGLHGFLANKWHFDELYDGLFMKPAHVIGKFCAWVDLTILDGILHTSSKVVLVISRWDRIFDENVVDGSVNLIARWTSSVGYSLRVIQTGRLRQYVMFIVVGVVALFAMLFSTFPR